MPGNVASPSFARQEKKEGAVVFPRNVAGKTLKREMREAYWAGRKVKV